MMRIFRLYNIILPLLTLLAVVSSPEANAEAVGSGNVGRRVVYISTAEDYKKFVADVNAGEYDLCAVLTADIDLNNETVDHIGGNGHPYRGIFDGKGHVISNFKVIASEAKGWDWNGMFGQIGSGAHICNFIVKDVYFKTGRYTGIVSDVQPSAYAIIENVGLINGNINASYDNAAGIVGRSYGILTVRNCFVASGSINGVAASSTMCGWNDGHTTFINCWNTADLKGIGADDANKFTHGGIIAKCRDKNLGNGLIAPDDTYYNKLVATGSWTYSDRFGHIIPTVVNIDDELNAFLNELESEWHKPGDFKTDLVDFKFVHTHGVVSPVNRGDSRTTDQITYRSTTRINEWCDWDKCFDADGNWIKDTQALAAAGIEIPSYRFLTSSDDDRIKKGVRQPAHTDESVVYAMPGDVVVLYPFREFEGHAKSDKYYENYIRWYDYETDGNNKYLGFYTDPVGVYKTYNIGYFGGKGMSDTKQPVLITTVDEYKRFVDRVNAGENTLNAILCADLDFVGRTDIRPIGTNSYKYAGIFDGDGHTLYNLTINSALDDYNKPTENAIGMFGYVKGPAVIRNFKLNNAKFDGKQWTGVVGFNDTGVIIIENVGFSGTSIAIRNASGILGANNSGNKANKILIRNCYVTGTITGKGDKGTNPESAAISGYAINADVVNCWSTASVTGADNPNNGMTYTFVRGYQSGYNVRLTNCYAKDGGNKMPTTPENLNTQEFADKLGSEYWQVSLKDGHVIPTNKSTKIIHEYIDRCSKSFTPDKALPSTSIDGTRTATIATFHVPENVTDFTEAVIAADMSQTFIRENNIDIENKLIYEPAIAFRRIFTIKNGATFAEEFSGSVEKNNEYIRKNRRHIKAPANKKFQIRLDFKMPTTNAGMSNIYYKKADGTYDRVHMFDIQVVDRTTGEVTKKVVFEGVGEYNGQGVRNGVNIGDGGHKFYRGIRCEAGSAIEGSYMVRLIAKDGNGAAINIAGTSSPLVIAEYELDFENTHQLSFVDEKTLKEDPAYAEHTDKYLEETYGRPYTTLDYDQYVALENLPDSKNYIYDTNSYSKYLKWPKPWERSTYGFGYNQRYDYNMYVYASHSSSTPYHQAADAANTATDNYGVAGGLFDRRFYDTGGKEHGYFGYSNAAADPGVIGNLYIDEICDGSTIYGTAWVAEFSNAEEVANIILNFNAVLKDGTTHALKSVTTGYIPKDKLGKWMHLYFSFTPNLSKHGLSANDVVSYHVTIENNCLSSVGADYAIDDIRLYVVKPRVNAQQSAPACGNDKLLDVKVETPFEVMLASTGSVEAVTEDKNELKYIYYTFIDKSKYEKALEDNKGSATQYRDAYEAAVLRYEYNLSGKTQRFGRFTFNTYYDKNPKYVGLTDKVGQSAYIETNPTTGERMLVFNTRPKDDELKVGKEYILAFYPSADGSAKELENIKEDPSAYFSIDDECAKICVFKVLPTDVVKIDGIAVSDLSSITVCKNHSPIVHVDLYGSSPDGRTIMDLIKKNAYMDWYKGSLDQYTAEKTTINGKELTLSEVIKTFRNEYPEARTWDVAAKGGYTEDMRQYLKKITAVDSKTQRAKLVLYRRSFLFPPLKAEEPSYVVAIPVPVNDADVIVCTDPIQLTLNVGEHSPRLLHGLPIDYPEDMDDVPLRIGLNQIKQTSGDKEELLAGTATSTPTLNIPIRSVEPVSEGVKTLLKTENIAICLAETNDPEYSIALAAASPDDAITENLIEVGVVKDLVASLNGGSVNLLSISFFNDIKFKEGYYYRLRFSFKEDQSELANPDEENSTACDGEQVFTIKVVPEYMQWTGAAGSRNWNNDLNWRRVTSDELLRAQDVNDEFTTDGSNANPYSYSPLDFTKAIIPAGIDSPYLFDIATTDVSMTEYGEAAALKHYSKPINEFAGDPSDDIEYDMAAKSKTNNVGCIPWYAHTCEQIHFAPNAEIMNQQYLSYNRAWAEFELSPDRWYTLASPLDATVAGDMYLPSVDARQGTELFKPITFSTSLNNRFAPAVYQRAWNKGTATVYEIKDGPKRNVADKTVWSNVYNDVNEKYTAGTGFSIKTDLSRLTGTVAKVLFRLPKDDASYDYYNEDGTIVGNNTIIDRKNAYKLNDAKKGTITVAAAAPCRYFLVGNPFMAHIDIAKFLEANADKINPKYWVLTDGGYAAAIKTETGGFTSTIGNPDVLAPMQGFFVETKAEAESVSLTYNSDMLCTRTYTGGESPLHAPSRSGDDNDCLRLTAMSDGEPVSQAIIDIKPEAVSEYSEREDVAMLDGDCVQSKAKIYTIAGNVAASINTLPEIGTTEIGLIAEDDHAQTTLHFNGADCVDGAMLYDTQSGEATPIYDDMEYTVEGSAVGRLFITTSLPGLADRDIRITQSGSTVSVTSPLPVSVNVYDMRGILMLTRYAESGITSFALEQGLYVVEAYNSDNIVRQKIAVR